jgi:hypothetical protein
VSVAGGYVNSLLIIFELNYTCAYVESSVGNRGVVGKNALSSCFTHLSNAFSNGGALPLKTWTLTVVFLL